MAHRAVARTLAPRLAPARRGFAAGAAAEPPVKLFGIPRATRRRRTSRPPRAAKTAQVEGELNALAATLAKDQALAGFVKNPTIPRAEKVAAVEKLFDGSKASSITVNTLTTLAANARLGEVDKVIEAYATS